MYEDESAFEDHLHSDHVQAFEDEITAYLTAERDIRKYHVESVERLDLSLPSNTKNYAGS